MLQIPCGVRAEGHELGDRESLSSEARVSSSIAHLILYDPQEHDKLKYIHRFGEYEFAYNVYFKNGKFNVRIVVGYSLNSFEYRELGASSRF